MSMSEIITNGSMAAWTTTIADTVATNPLALAMVVVLTVLLTGIYDNVLSGPRFLRVAIRTLYGVIVPICVALLWNAFLEGHRGDEILYWVSGSCMTYCFIDAFASTLMIFGVEKRFASPFLLLGGCIPGLSRLEGWMEKACGGPKG